MFDTFRHHSARACITAAPMPAFFAVALVGLIVVGAGTWALAPGAALITPAITMTVFALAMTITLVGLCAGYPHRRLGACNMVTQVRAMLAAILTTAIIVPAVADHAAIALFALAITALSLDGIDGALARHAGLTSDFGARFDMEVDAALGAILSLILIRTGVSDTTFAQACLIVLGFARYGFVVAGWRFAWLKAPLPYRLSRRVICVVQIATLAGLLLPAVASHLASFALPVAASLILWSFARDILWLARNRPGVAA